MRKIVLTISIYDLSLIVKSQNTSVDKSTFGIQTGFLEIWIHNESKLLNQFALRIELGLDTRSYGSDINNEFLIAPTIGYPF